MKSYLQALVAAALAMALSVEGAARPVPRPALIARLAEGIDLIGIVHWGLNTYTDREWGYGDEDPAMLNPTGFDADQIVGACKAGGLKGLVVVAKHHDGFCLWPTKTTEHNITKSPFRGGKGDYVREMADACRRAGICFGVYVSPWDRNSAHYATEKYVELYHAQIKELLGGGYGDVFEMWFDGANGGDGWYGGAKGKRKIGAGYYRFGEVFRFVRELQPKVTIFAGENDSSDFRWPGNERGMLNPGSRATVVPTGGFADGKYRNPAYKPQINTGTPGGAFFRMCEADFPLRKGWFYHERERGTTKRAAYLAQRYVGTVGNGGIMNIGIAPNRAGVLDEADVRELRDFKATLDALFAHEANDGEPFNVLELREDLANGEQVDGWRIIADGREILSGTAIGYRRIRLLADPVSAKVVKLEITAHGGDLLPVAMRRYHADPQLVKSVIGASGDCGETDTAKGLGDRTAAATVECKIQDKAVQFAAKDLGRYLAGAKVTVALVEDPSLASQEWRIQADRGKVTISGRDGMGIVYGAYGFLEKHLGFRWYAPDVSRLPDMAGKDLSSLKIDERCRPAILEREMYVGSDYMDSSWRLRNKETKRAAFGVGVSVGAPRDCHTFSWYNDAIGAKGKPELLGVNAKGKMTGLFCPSNPEVRRLVAEQMKKLIRKDREACRRSGAPRYAWPTVYELSQDDGGGVGDSCMCPECKTIFDASGSWSGVNIAFASAVAEQVAQEFSDVIVRTFAYSYTERPPTNDLRAVDSVSARYCRSFVFQPLTAGTDNGRIMREWDRHVAKKHVWGYWRSYSGPLFPMVKPRKDIGDEMRFCREMNVVGYFAEDEAPLSRSFAMMQHWLFLKLAEDPGQDVFALSDEFIRAYYGKAAKPISEYLGYLERRQMECHAKIDRAFLLGVNSGNLAQYVQRAYLDAEFFRTANALLDEAERLASGDDSAALHVGHERLVVDRTMRSIASQLAQQGYNPDLAAAAARIENTLPALVRGWKGFGRKELEARLAAVRREIAVRKRPLAALPRELSGREVWAWEAADMAGGFSSERIVDDPAARLGVALRFPTRYQKFVSPFFAGAYDNLGRSGCELSRPSSQLPQDGKYHLFRLGTIRVLSPCYVYYNSWHYRTWLPTLGLEPERREIWISARFDGPAYVKGSNAEIQVLYDGLFLVKPAADCED